MRPAPWIDEQVISEGRKLAGVSLVTVPPGTRTPVPAQTRSDVPPGVAVSVPLPRASQPWPPAPQAGPAPADGPGPDAIIGIAAAAGFLGYDKPESFRRARTRTPIPGEGKLPDGRPYWPPHALRDCHSGRKIAGNRTPSGGPD